MRKRILAILLLPFAAALAQIDEIGGIATSTLDLTGYSHIGGQVIASEGGGAGYSSYLDLDGTSDYISTPDSAANSVIGSCEIIAKVRLADYTPADGEAILGKWGGSNSAFLFLLNSSGYLQFAWYRGGGFQTAIADATLGATDDTDLWIRCVVDTASSEVRFYKSTTAGLPGGGDWTQVGASQSTVSSNYIRDTTDALYIGSHEVGDHSDGRFYYVALYNSSSTLVAEFDASNGTDPTYNNVSGETAWTNNGGTPGS